MVHRGSYPTDEAPLKLKVEAHTFGFRFIVGCSGKAIDLKQGFYRYRGHRDGYHILAVTVMEWLPRPPKGSKN